MHSPVSPTESPATPPTRRRKSRQPICVWAFVPTIAGNPFLSVKLLNEAATRAEHDVWMRRVWPDPKSEPGNLLIGRLDAAQAVRRWNTYRPA